MRITKWSAGNGTFVCAGGMKMWGLLGESTMRTRSFRTPNGDSFEGKWNNFGFSGAYTFPDGNIFAVNIPVEIFVHVFKQVVETPTLYDSCFSYSPEL